MSDCIQRLGGLVLQILRVAETPLSAPQIARAISLKLGVRITKKHIMSLLIDGVQWGYLSRDDGLYALPEDPCKDIMPDSSCSSLFVDIASTAENSCSEDDSTPEDGVANGGNCSVDERAAGALVKYEGDAAKMDTNEKCSWPEAARWASENMIHGAMEFFSMSSNDEAIELKIMRMYFRKKSSEPQTPDVVESAGSFPLLKKPAHTNLRAT